MNPPQIRNGELDQHEARELCEENNSPIAQIFAGAITKWGRPAVEVEQAIVDAGERTTFALRKNLRVFSAIDTLGPLLGLVGTVFGIIRAFNALSLKGAEDRGQQLANGIAQSLLATFFGLIVAIPALVCYLWFMSKADQLTYEMDGLAQDLVGAARPRPCTAGPCPRTVPPRPAWPPSPKPPAARGKGKIATAFARILIRG